MAGILRPALVLFATLSLLTGIGYPIAVTALGQWMFPAAAQGSLIRDGERLIGSMQIGQSFADPRFFWSRPSATGPVPYNAATSAGSNLGPTNPALHRAVAARIEALGGGRGRTGPIPADLVTASGSGLDPHLSPAGAYFQASRVAEARGIPESTVRSLIEAHIEPRSLGVLGEPRVNVLLLNLALERFVGNADHEVGDGGE